MSHFLKGISADKFNEKYPVGSHFVYFPVKGIPDGVEVVTRTPAWALGHGAVVVSVEGRAGGLCIEHLKPVTDSVLRSESTSRGCSGHDEYGGWSANKPRRPSPTCRLAS